jgi:DNA-binding PadR family transcriptional regulator
VTENNRRANYYELTAAGGRQFGREAEQWAQTSGAVNRILRFVPGEA